MIIEKYEDTTQSLVLPESVKGELFRILDIGPGYITNFGKRLKPDLRVNDVVAIVGNILTIPFQGENYQIARSGDVIAYWRPDKEDIGIPERI